MQCLDYRLLDLSLSATSGSKELLQKPLLLDIPTAGGKNLKKPNKIQKHEAIQYCTIACIEI